MHFGEQMCKVRFDGRKRNSAMLQTMEVKRFTVSLEQRDYDSLRRIAQSQRPQLSLQYAVRYALQEFLNKREGRKLTLRLDGDKQE